MDKVVRVVIVLVLVLGNSAYAHKLPQQINSNISSNNIASEHMSFLVQEINHWSQYAKTLDISSIAELAGVPTLISYSVSTVAKSNQGVECSIYVDEGSDKVSTLCGDLDEHSRAFMKAAISAIGYCHFRQTELQADLLATNEAKQLVPYFKGPASFMASVNESTHGNHHNNYQVAHGLDFHCVELNDPAGTAEPTSNDANL